MFKLVAQCCGTCVVTFGWFILRIMTPNIAFNKIQILHNANETGFLIKKCHGKLYQVIEKTAVVKSMKKKS